MSVSRAKTWIAGEVLTASDLNSEFNNVLNNGQTLAWPATEDKNFDGFNIDNLGVIFMKEQAEADADQAGLGQLWVDTATPNVLKFTDDAGTDWLLNQNVLASPLSADLDFGGNNMDNGGVIFLTEQAAADADVAGKGQIWVLTATPNVLKFTDDAGTDFLIYMPGTAIAGTDGGTIGQQTVYVPAAAMEAAVTTAPAASNAVEIGTSLFAARTMDFATGADDFCYFQIQMPKSWDAGTLICQFVWSATGTTGNTVLWAIAAVALGDDEVLTTAFPAAVSPAADTNSTTADDLMISAEVTVTVGDTPAAENFVMFEVSRDVSGDTLAEDARLHGIRIHYTVDTGIDT